MAKLCDVSLCKPFELIFGSCLQSGKFPLELKKANYFCTQKGETSKYWKTSVPYLCLPLPEK